MKLGGGWWPGDHVVDESDQLIPFRTSGDPTRCRICVRFMPCTWPGPSKIPPTLLQGDGPAITPPPRRWPGSLIIHSPLERAWDAASRPSNRPDSCRQEIRSAVCPNARSRPVARAAVRFAYFVRFVHLGRRRTERSRANFLALSSLWTGHPLSTALRSPQPPRRDKFSTYRICLYVPALERSVARRVEKNSQAGNSSQRQRASCHR